MLCVLEPPLVCALFALLYVTLQLIKQEKTSFDHASTFFPPSSYPEGETLFLAQPPRLLASVSMADSRQPEDDAPQWDPSGGQEPGGTHGANGYSSSAYRTCQPGGACYSVRENGFNGELTGAHAITAGNMSYDFFIIL